MTVSKFATMAKTTLAAAAVVTGALVSATPANAAVNVSGQVMCVSQANVVGVWIAAASGGSGWATRTDVNGYTANYRYSLPNGGSYAVHVGCGGTSQNWATNNKSFNVSGTSNSFTCYDIPNAGYQYLRCQRT